MSFEQRIARFEGCDESIKTFNNDKTLQNAEAVVSKCKGIGEKIPYKDSYAKAQSIIDCGESIKTFNKGDKTLENAEAVVRKCKGIGEQIPDKDSYAKIQSIIDCDTSIKTFNMASDKNLKIAEDVVSKCKNIKGKIPGKDEYVKNAESIINAAWYDQLWKNGLIGLVICVVIGANVIYVYFTYDPNDDETNSAESDIIETEKKKNKPKDKEKKNKKNKKDNKLEKGKKRKKNESNTKDRELKEFDSDVTSYEPPIQAEFINIYQVGDKVKVPFQDSDPIPAIIVKADNPHNIHIKYIGYSGILHPVRIQYT
jgi:uncharacterized lipoprotein YehR (DUF1307 family)